MPFKFRDGTNLQSPGKSHKHTLWVRLRNADAFERSETYNENGKAPGGTVEDATTAYTRVAASIAKP